MKQTNHAGFCIQFPRANQATFEPFSTNRPESGQVLLKTKVSLLSTGTETIVFSRNFDAGTHWDDWVRYPFFPGYACAGVVVETGPDVTGFRPGDLVVCRQGHRSHSTLSASDCYPVPAGLPPEEAVWFPLAKIAGHGVRAAGITLGDSVAIIGAGPIGQMTARWALAAGAGKVVVMDRAETRLAMAASAGAIPVQASAEEALDQVRSALGGAKPRVVIDTTGNAAVLQTAFGLVADFGTVVLLGDTGSPARQTLTADVITRGIRLVGAHDGHNTAEWNNPVAAAHFFHFVLGGRFSMRGLNTHCFSPAACQEAYDLAAGDRLRTMGILFDWSLIAPRDKTLKSN